MSLRTYTVIVALIYEHYFSPEIKGCESGLHLTRHRVDKISSVSFIVRKKFERERGTLVKLTDKF